jgi:transcriptional activator SPT8
VNNPRPGLHQQWDLNTGQIARKFIAHGSQLVGIAVRPITSGYSRANVPTAKNTAEDSGATHFRPTEPMQVSTQSTEPASGKSGAVGKISSTMASNNLTSTQSDGHAANSTQAADSDAKSEMSYDPLFDDEPDADGEPESENNGQWQQGQKMDVLTFQGGLTTLAIPSQSTSQASGRVSMSSAAVPKNTPPLLDSANYATFSPDILMTASIDGQIILWDKRVNTPRKGVGRLEMSEKTPPWCVSVCAAVVADVILV